MHFDIPVFIRVIGLINFKGVPSEKARDDVMEVVREHFAPEFLNRIDDIILFNRLSRENMNFILDLQIQSISFFFPFLFYLFLESDFFRNS